MSERAQQINFNRIVKAISYLSDFQKEQPTLEQVASHVHLSPFHFQRIFTAWAGVSPKKFQQFLNVEFAKRKLSESQMRLGDVALESGLSGTGRLHDLFVNIEGMTPAEYRDGGEALQITWQCYSSVFGEVFIANTNRGVCFMSFDGTSGLDQLSEAFPNAKLVRKSHRFQMEAAQAIDGELHDLPKIKLHLRATPFQLKVWNALLRIPPGQLLSYGQLAAESKAPTAVRAVGTAIGKNPVAYLIPCHRVIRSTGVFGNYRWGATRKAAMIGWEAGKYQKFWQLKLEKLENELT